MSTKDTNILKPSRIRYTETESDVQTYLAETYAQKRSVFSVASPFGQILKAVKEFAQLIFYYIEDSLVELNMTTASKQRSIYGLARLAGHNPTRALSAHGTLRMKLKPSAASEVNATYIVIPDKVKVRCANNGGLPYFVQLGNAMESIRVDMNYTGYTTVPIVQGELETQSFVGTGRPLQSFVAQSKQSRPIENELVFIKVNGEPFEVVDSLYDMRKGEKLCMVKTGLSTGVDIFFGNEDFGYIPPAGSAISVEYVVTDGFQGNVFGRSSSIKFEWADKGYTNNGDEVDLNQVFDTNIEKALVLGADTEPSDVTKLIAPKTSRSYVLANPDNYVNLLSRFNYSHVDAYTTFGDDYIQDDNVVYLFLVPDLSRRLSTSTDYYSVPLTALYLDPDEKAAVIAYIHQSGRMIVSTELEVIDPTIKKYALNVFLRVFDWADQKSVRADVVSVVTDYMLKVGRKERLPKSDIVALVEGINGVDSVNLSFVSEDNEKAIIDGYYTATSFNVDRIRGIRTPVTKRVTLGPNDDPNLGFDDFGDVLVSRNDMPVLRGGWYDRFGTYYEDGLSADTCPLNVFIKETVKDTLSMRISRSNREKLKR